MARFKITAIVSRDAYTEGEAVQWFQQLIRVAVDALYVERGQITVEKVERDPFQDVTLRLTDEEKAIVESTLADFRASKAATTQEVPA